jgi:hypothetical protein
MTRQSELMAPVTHVALVIDESASMGRHRETVVKVVDSQITYLAQRSRDLDQETRITVYVFGSRDRNRCLVYDKDVLRMPSIAKLYRPSGMTALMDATALMLNDLAMTPTKYGDHSFLAFVITDGLENNSLISRTDFRDKVSALPETWTLGILVPDAMGIHEAKSLGFHPGNISIWSTTSSTGVEEVGESIRRATDTHMTTISKGLRPDGRSLFVADVDPKEISSVLTPLTSGSYQLLDVKEDSRADDFSRLYANRFVLGQVFYQLGDKSVKIQPQKEIAILKDGKVFMGRAARDMLGLPSDKEVRVRAGQHKNYTILVQSTAPNRKLLAGTKALILR